jgi:DNA-binding NarL/FixJ family response regulator
MPPITVVIAERGEADRSACLRLLEPEEGIEVVGEARSGLDVVMSTARLRPRILLLDLVLARAGRVPLIPVLRQSEDRTLEALYHGARGYLDKSLVGKFLPRAVRVVDAGEAWVPRKMVSRIMDHLAGLTARAGKST